jgi:hypothetical protein
MPLPLPDERARIGGRRQPQEMTHAANAWATKRARHIPDVGDTTGWPLKTPQRERSVARPTAQSSLSLRSAASARSARPDDGRRAAAERQLRRVELALSRREHSQPTPSVTPNPLERAAALPVQLAPTATAPEQQLISAAVEAALQKERGQFEAERQVALQTERRQFEAEREQHQLEMSQLVAADEHYAEAAAAQVEAARREHESRVSTATLELKNATATIQELEERVAASELAVDRTEASEQELQRRLAYEQASRAKLERELHELQKQMVDDHAALSEANESKAAVAAQLAAVEAESKQSQSEADRALEAATAALARARAKAENRVAAVRREAEETTRDAKEELQRRVRELQLAADARVAAARRQGDHYRLEAETLNLTSTRLSGVVGAAGFRSPNGAGTALDRHRHLAAPEETFGESFTQTVRVPWNVCPLPACHPHTACADLNGWFGLHAYQPAFADTVATF